MQLNLAYGTKNEKIRKKIKIKLSSSEETVRLIAGLEIT